MPHDLTAVERIGAQEDYLAVVATTRQDGTVQSSLVNAGIIDHPGTGRPVLAFVTYGAAKKAHLRARPHTALTFRSGWHWVTVEGAAELLGPDDPGMEPERLRLLLREIFRAAGGRHEDWAEYDRVMRSQRRAAVLIRPDRVYGS